MAYVSAESKFTCRTWWSRKKQPEFTRIKSGKKKARERKEMRHAG